MNIFRLTWKYPEGMAKEACRYTGNLPILPGISCWGVPGACGEIWANVMARIFQEWPPDHPLKFPTSPVDLNTFQKIKQVVGETLKLSDWHSLLPGTRIGKLQVTCSTLKVLDFQWFLAPNILMSANAREQLVSEQFTGWRAEPVTVVGKCTGYHSIELYELVIEGRAGPAVTFPATHLRSKCEICGREVYERHRLERFEIEEKLWDGSDLMRFDPPFEGYVFVTERVKRFLDQSRLTGVEAVSVEQFLQSHRSVLHIPD